MNTTETKLKHGLKTLEELSLIYTPGVGFSSKEIARDKNLVNTLTNRKNSLAVIYDCKDFPESYLVYADAVCNIIKSITNIDAYPLVSLNYDINKLIENLAPSFAGFYIFTNENITNKNIIYENEKSENYNVENIINKAKKLEMKFKNINTQNPLFDENDFRTQSINLRQKLCGVIETENPYKNKTPEELKNIFAKEKLDVLSKKIKNNSEEAYIYTSKKNTTAVISDGSAVLGLGNIGAEAGLPVMEGKAAIFKELGNVNAVPICLKTQNKEELINLISAISYSFGGINLEDINAPRCFEIEEKLSEKTNIPIFHDDQHGTAIIVLAALLGALKLANKKIEDIKIVMSGAGAAAQAVAKLILKAGAKNLIMSDIDGVISKTSLHTDFYLRKIADITNLNNENGNLKDVLKGADVLIGLSAANIVSEEMIKSMNNKAIVFVLANPVPEIMPDKAKNAGAFIVATGRSDFENQINNSLAFPGIFKGLLSKKIKKVTEDMKYKCALAITDYASKNLSAHKILPDALDRGIVDEIAKVM